MLILRKNAPQLIQNVIIGFAFSVLAIRLYLEVTPVTILLVGEFHVAHMLYGGLLLLIAGLLFLTYQNSRIQEVSSWLIGIGFGFFMDELGKYISISQDYYFRPAAPLIYLSFLGIVYFFFFIKKRHQPTLQEQVYYVLDDIKKAWEDRLSMTEFNQIKKILRQARKQKDDAVYQELAQQLLDFLPAIKNKVVIDEESRLDRYEDRFRKLVRSLLTRKSTRYLFYIVFGVRIAWVVPSLVMPLIQLLPGTSGSTLVDNLLKAELITGNRELYPFLFTALMEVLVAAGLFLGLGLYVLRRRGGLWLMRRLLLFSILFLGLFNVYFGQFSAFISIIIDTALLIVLDKLQKPRMALAREV